MPDLRFSLDWYAGASAEIELFAPSAEAAHHQFKYTPAFRSTIRPPLERKHLTAKELGPINKRLDGLISTLDARSAAVGSPIQPPKQPASDTLGQMEMLGNQLLDLILAQHIQADLRRGGLLLEIGVDESLLDYPWELMHDGDGFLCLKHAMGRFVHGARQMIPMRQRPADRLRSPLEELSILIISVPNPQPRDGITYENLPEAEAETEAIIDSLSNIDGVKVDLLPKRKATYDNVYKALKENHQIVHFNGHAYFDKAEPRNSGLVLFDQNLTTGAVASYMGANPPVLCFVNACETAKTAEIKEWKNHYDIFGLARAFLDTDAYLLGSRCKVSDRAAAAFARSFYISLIKQGEPLGAAIRDARKLCKESVPQEDFAWASYVFYGDPRIYFRRL
jgi:CHAT domain-containing protein